MLIKSTRSFLHWENHGEVTSVARETEQVREHRGKIVAICKARVCVNFMALSIITHRRQYNLRQVAEREEYSGGN